MTTKQFNPLTGPLTGRNLIEASAGTGKTFTISRIFLRLLLERGLEVNRILVVTFTEAATNELKERILTTLNQAHAGFLGRKIEERNLQSYVANYRNSARAMNRLELAIQNFDEAAVFTIHGFCNRVLQENAFESGSLFDTELVHEQSALLREIVQDFWRTHFYQASTMFLQFALKKTSPEALLKLLGKRVGRLHLHILPDLENIDSTAAEIAFQNSYSQVRDLWQNYREEINRILVQEPGWNQHKYKSASIPLWLEELDSYASMASVGFQLFEKFEKFTSSSVSTGKRKNHQPPQHPFFDACQTHFDNYLALESCFEKQLLYLQTRLFDYVQAELVRRKEVQNVFYFDDLLLRLHSALDKPGAGLAQSVRDKFKAALIDEFQDTDPVQYEIFNRVFNTPDSTLFLIGDPKQAIYSFRGADIFTYMQAKADTGPEQQYTLFTNYRSEPKLVSGINAIFGNIDKAFIYEEIPFQHAVAADRDQPERLVIAGEAEGPLRLWYLDPAENEINGKKPNRAETVAAIAEAVATEIVRLLNLSRQKKALLGNRPLEKRDIAVLVRTNAEALTMQSALTKRNVNSVVYGSGSLFTSPEAQELECILAAVVEPEHSGRLKVALTTEIIGLSGSELFSFAKEDNGLEKWQLRFAGYNRLWQQTGFMRMFRELSAREKLLPRLMAFHDGERRVTNLLHLAELLNTAAVEQKLGKAGLLKWLTEQRNNIDKSNENYQVRLESDEKAIKLITVHKSKGLEFPVIFCPYLWSGSNLIRGELPEFHDDLHDGDFTLDLGSENLDRSKSLARKEKLAENLRLLYVALTRAQFRSYLVWGPLNWQSSVQAASSAMAYLLHRPTPLENDQPVETLEEHCKNLKNEAYQNAVDLLAANSNGAVAVAAMPESSAQLPGSGMESAVKLSCRSFSADIDSSTRISSYSSLVARQPHGGELADHDVVSGLIVANMPQPEQPPADDFSHFRWFPRGTGTGLFIHDLLEHFDFTTLDDSQITKVILQKLESHGFDVKWANAVYVMLKNVLQTPLPTAGNRFSLSEITSLQRLNELEFYFPLQALTPATFKRVFDKQTTGALPQGFPQKIEELTFAPVQGYMKGFIDLVFEFDGLFYLVDWKSNYLGPNLENYDSVGLTSAMVESYYVLQYHIYAVALNQYLKRRLPDYDYEKHFGGVFYIFLRGVEQEKGSEFGIFYERPAAQLIAELVEGMSRPEIG